MLCNYSFKHIIFITLHYISVTYTLYIHVQCILENIANIVYKYRYYKYIRSKFNLLAFVSKRLEIKGARAEKCRDKINLLKLLS